MFIEMLLRKRKQRSANCCIIPIACLIFNQLRGNGMRTSSKFKFAMGALFVVLLSACSGGGGDSHTSFMVGNTRQGFVCVEDIGFFGPTSAESTQITFNLLSFYGIADPLAQVPVFSTNSYCGDTSLPTPAPNLIIDADYYHNVIEPAVR